MENQGWKKKQNEKWQKLIFKTSLIKMTEEKNSWRETDMQTFWEKTEKGTTW